MHPPILVPLFCQDIVTSNDRPPWSDPLTGRITAATALLPCLALVSSMHLPSPLSPMPTSLLVQLPGAASCCCCHSCPPSRHSQINNTSVILCPGGSSSNHFPPSIPHPLTQQQQTSSPVSEPGGPPTPVFLSPQPACSLSVHLRASPALTRIVLLLHPTPAQLPSKKAPTPQCCWH